MAESITRRFFNVIHLLSHSIPIIAIQVSLVDVGNNKALHFTKVLDTYEEVDDGTSEQDNEAVTRDYWSKKAKWTVDAADSLHSVVGTELQAPKIGYLKNYVSITVGRNIFFALRKRSSSKTLLGFRIAPHLIDDAQQIFDAIKVSPTRTQKGFRIITDSETINANSEAFSKLAGLVRRTWEKSA